MKYRYFYFLIGLWVVPLEAAERQSEKYAALKFQEVNWRSGPGYEHSVRWIYRCPGLPVTILRKCGYWYYIKDYEGMTGWVHTNLLIFKRMLLVIQDMATLRRTPHPQGTVVAYIKQGVSLRFHKYQDGWYYVSIPRTSHKGWILENMCWSPQ